MLLQILFLGPSNLLDPNANFPHMWQTIIVSPIVSTPASSKVPEKVSLLTDAKSSIILSFFTHPYDL